MSENVFKTHHIAHVTYDKQGRPKCTVPFTDKKDKKRYVMAVPPSRVIPVIFVPGIMGSNLKLLKPVSEKLKTTQTGNFEYKGPAWLPDDSGFLIKKYMTAEAAERRRILDPNNTEVAPLADMADAGLAKGFGDLPKEVKANLHQEFTRRGWPTVMLKSYGPILSVMESYLNRIFYHGEAHPFWHEQILGITAEELGKVTGFNGLKTDELTKAADYWYPVHAFGYNWLRSNEEAGKKLAEFIDSTLAHYKKLNYTTSKVILVTHSMGGLVGRAACHPSMGNAASKVLGVVHGEMPANGAGVAYRRQHAGFEGGAALVLGWDGPEVAAVFSNSPGALQLLPNKQYGSNWLQVQDKQKQVLLSLPKADPYAEIYRQSEPFWRLMNPAWLDPCEITLVEQEAIQDVWTLYLENLKVAEKFHDSLSDYYHPNTYAHYGDDPKQAAWGKVIWQETQYWPGTIDKNTLIMTGSVLRADGQGQTEITPLNVNDRSIQAWDSKGDIHTRGVGWRGELGPANQSGDGTVPAMSGNAPGPKAKLLAGMRGFDHQGSYTDNMVQLLTLHSIAKIAQDAA